MGEKAELTNKTPNNKHKNAITKGNQMKPEQSKGLLADQILFLQQTVGNHGVQRLLKADLPQVMPETSWKSGKHTVVGRYLAPELRQPTGTIARAVSPDYPKINSNLTYGVFDWAITDNEAHQVLVILAALNPTDFADTLRRMDNDGLVNRLLENISTADQTAYAPLIRSIHQQRSASSTANHIRQLMSYGLLDWVITDAEAHLALEALKGLQADPARLRDVIVAIPANQYERFYDNLSATDRRDNLRFLQDIEMIRSTGMTFAEMSQQQRLHLETQATAAGVSVGEYIRGEVASRGYGGNVATWWPSLTAAEKASWQNRFNTVLQRIRNSAPDEIKEIIRSAEAAGGGIQFQPQRVEELGPSTFAYRSGNVLGVGKSWLVSAEGGIADVYDNISHELGGHLDYGNPASWDIMTGTLNALPAGERAIAQSGSHSVYSAYAYMETEIYAELRELPYRTPGSQTDNPNTDVENQLRNLKAAYAPAIAAAVVRGFRRRIQLDSRVTDAARTLFDKKARVVFGITF